MYSILIEYNVFNINWILIQQHSMPWCCCCSAAKSCLTLCDPMDCSMPGFPVLYCLLEFAQIMSIELVMLSNHTILCCPLLLLASIFPSIRVFSNESALYIRGPKYWSFSISPSNEYSGLFSFRIDQFVNNFKYNVNSMYIVAYQRQIQVLLLGTFWSVCFFFQSFWSVVGWTYGHGTHKYRADCIFINAWSFQAFWSHTSLPC